MVKSGERSDSKEMERDLPDDVLLLILNCIFTSPKMNSLAHVKKIIKIGTISRHFRQIEKLFWRQIVTQNRLLHSKLTSSRYKDNPKLLHLAHYFGCDDGCHRLARYHCINCDMPMCHQCYEENHAPECGCDPSQIFCRFCCETCDCKIRVCGNCSKQCSDCDKISCAKCYEGGYKYKCCDCDVELCKHQITRIRCECKEDKYICSKDWNYHITETTCIKCQKAICSDCGYDCQNCSHRVCHDCAKKVGKWYTCKDRCIGDGLAYTKCHQCKEEIGFVYDSEIGRCGNCEPLLAEDVKLCKNCVDTCQKCHRKFCLTCLNFHEPICKGLIQCSTCRAIVPGRLYNWCSTSEREAGCDRCAIGGQYCHHKYCTMCAIDAEWEKEYDLTSCSWKTVQKCYCALCSM